jgi:hypothetical protein
MPYRDDAHSLRAYRDQVSAELEEARRAAREASVRAKSVAKLEQDLAAVEAKLASFAKRDGSGPRLEDVRIAAPCGASWDAMKGDDRVRFCGKCEKNVYNLSAMTREDAEALLADRAGNICVRLYKRADGTVITEDCPVGQKRRRRVRLAIAAVGGGLMAASAAMMSRQEPPLMGSIPVSSAEAPKDVAPTMGIMLPVETPETPSAVPIHPIMGAPAPQTIPVTRVTPKAPHAPNRAK